MSEQSQARHRADVAFTPAVQRAQAERGSRDIYERKLNHKDWSDTITPILADFIAERDSAYLGTASRDGQPYIQHRGGPVGFIKVIDEHTLAFADYSGNRQYISLGNLSENDQAFLFLMDYANQRRVKLWGRAHFVEGDDELIEQVRDDDYPAAIERVLSFRVVAWDINCPSHISPRVSTLDYSQSRG
jgi:predicted pyridoxine 5'-phosphate oxidase superfamily flavin-nucleotide-binding protein